MQKLNQSHITAVNGLEALHTYEAAKGGFNLIFMDISMPIMDGLQASRKIRDFERQQDIPPTIIVALTGAASAKSRQEASRSGVDLFLTKPVPMKKLKGILQDLRKGEVHQ
jgi:CheY-like chemotaxis protein